MGVGVRVGVGVAVGVGVTVGVGVGVGMGVAVGGSVGVGRAADSTMPTVGGAESHAANASARSIRARSAGVRKGQRLQSVGGGESSRAGGGVVRQAHHERDEACHASGGWHPACLIGTRRGARPRGRR